MIYVSIIEDDSEIRNGISSIINSTEGYKCVGAYESCEKALSDFEDNLPDVILMDISLPGMNGIDCTKIIKEKYSDVDVIMLTVHNDDSKVFDSLCAGACGYLMKNTPTDKIIDFVKEAVVGGAPMSTTIARMVVSSFKRSKNPLLTDREKEVLVQLCNGSSYRAIADKLFVSADTVHFHIKNIYKKLQVHSKSEAVAKAIKDKIV